MTYHVTCPCGKKFSKETLPEIRKVALAIYKKYPDAGKIWVKDGRKNAGSMMKYGNLVYWKTVNKRKIETKLVNEDGTLRRR